VHIDSDSVADLYPYLFFKNMCPYIHIKGFVTDLDPKGSVLIFCNVEIDFLV